MQIDPATITRIAAATGTDAADVAVFVPVFVETAARLIAAGEITIDDMNTDAGFALVGRVASERIARVLRENVDTIAERVWERANIA